MLLLLSTMGAKGSKSKDRDKGGKGGAKISQSDMAIVSRHAAHLKSREEARTSAKAGKGAPTLFPTCACAQHTCMSSCLRPSPLPQLELKVQRDKLLQHKKKVPTPAAPRVRIAAAGSGSIRLLRDAAPRRRARAMYLQICRSADC